MNQSSKQINEQTIYYITTNLPSNILIKIFEYLPMETNACLMQIKKFYNIIMHSDIWKTKYCRFNPYCNEKFIQNFFAKAHLQIENLEITNYSFQFILDNLKRYQCPKLKNILISTLNFPSSGLNIDFNNCYFLSTPLSIYHNIIHFNNITKLEISQFFSLEIEPSLKYLFLPNLPNLKIFILNQEVLNDDLDHFLSQRSDLIELHIQMNQLNPSQTKSVSQMVNLVKLTILIMRQNLTWPNHLSLLTHLESLNLFFKGSPELIKNYFIYSDLKNLRELTFNSGTFHPCFVEIMVKKCNLEKLNLIRLELYLPEVLEFLELLQDLKHLNIIQCSGFNTKHLFFLSKLKKLKHLSLKGCDVQDEIFKYIKKNKNLDSLDLSCTSITSKSLFLIKKYLHLYVFVSSIIIQEKDKKYIEDIPLVLKQRV